MPIDYATDVRLEVEAPATGLRNLILNGNGELGGWGWITPIADSLMTTEGDGLIFYGPTAAQATHFTSEVLPVAAGDYAAAYLYAQGGTGWFRLRFDWLNSLGALIGSSAQTGYTLSNAGDVVMPPAQAPAGTVYALLRVDLYGDNAGAIPGASSLLEFTNVTVATAPVAADLGTVRINLCPEPSFETGTYGWEAYGNAELDRTSALAAAGSWSALLTRTGAGRAGMRTFEGLYGIPITGGVFYALSAETGADTLGTVPFLGLRFYDSTGKLLAGSAEEELSAVDVVDDLERAGRLFFAPANAVTAAIDVGTVDGLAGELAYADAVLLERADVHGDYFDKDTPDTPSAVHDASTHAARVTKTRVNRSLNPSLETNATKYGGDNAARVNAGATAGSYALRFHRSGAGTGTGAYYAGNSTTGVHPVTPGNKLAFAVELKASVARGANLAITYLRADYTQVGSAIVGAVATVPTGAHARYVLAGGTVPAGATQARFTINVPTCNTLEYFYADSWLIEDAATVGDYFDGDTPDEVDGWLAVDRAWNGTAHASSSTETERITVPYATQLVSELAYIPPVEYRNILGSANTIRATREELNLGTLTALIIDPALDPAQADALLVEGRRVRLTALVADRWETLFPGRIDNASAEYVPDHPDPSKRARITLTVVDAIKVLGNVRRPQGVSTIDELPFVLEGAGVPWNVNGSGAQVATAAVVAVNDSATALDQLALTRDGTLGRAWVDRNGIAQVWDADQLPTTVVRVLDETAYSDVSIDFDSDRCIDNVTVVVVNELGEQTFGPYVAAGVDNPSHGAEFRVQWADADPVAVAAYADAILDANAIPKVRINSVVLPVRETSDALLELYDLVTASNANAGLVDDVRVAGLTHNLTIDRTTGGRWTLEVDLVDGDKVPFPQDTPPLPPSSTAQTLAALLRPVGEVTMFYCLPSQIPAGWVAMHSSTFDAGAYPDLAAFLGVPAVGTQPLGDMTDRIPVGAGVKALGAATGAWAKSLPNHAHSDTFAVATATLSAQDNTATGGTSKRIFQETHGHSLTGAVGNPTSNPLIDVTPPVRALYFAIRAVAGVPA